MKNIFNTAIFLNKYHKIFRIMRLTLCLLLFFTSLAFAEDSYAQNARVNLNSQQAALKDVLKEIEQQTDYLFISNRDINLETKVSIRAKNKPVREVLDKLFASTDLSYDMEGVNIIISQRNAAAETIQQQTDKRIIGTVVDSNGEPIIGANISEKGTKNGTASDVDGKFSLQVNPDAVLVISYIGYTTQEVVVGNQTNLNITLSESNLALDEVVVVGYGTMQRKNFTGSVSTVNVANSPVALSSHVNAMDILRGTITGATVSREADAGSTPSIEVHGQKSVNSSNTNPLVVLDGVKFMGNWRDIDPKTIESMSVLKDPTSLAAYGSQAANGVVMITTKKGALGKPMISFDGSLTMANKAMTPKLLHPESFVDYRNDLNKTTNPQSWMSSNNYLHYLTGQTTDWWDYATQTGLTQNYSLSVSGATEKFNYYVSVSHTDQKGIVIGDEYSREVLTSNLRNDITNWLQVGVQVNYSYQNYDGTRAGSGNLLNPYAEPYRRDDNGELVPGNLIEKKIHDVGGSDLNPLWNTSLGGLDDYERYATTLLKGHILLKAPWIEGLTFRLNALWSQENYNHNYFSNERYNISGNEGEWRYTPEGLATMLPRATGYNQVALSDNYVWDNILNYTNQLGKHFVDVTAVYTRDQNRYQNRRLNGTDFSAIGNTLLGYDGLAFAKTQTFSISKNAKANIGYMGRLNYNYDGRYHLTASVRRDGSSVFGADRKWGVFPAVGVAWTASNEAFMKNIGLISYLKLKGSWGKNGNQSLNPYGTLTTINLGRNGGHPQVFGNDDDLIWAQYISSLGNPALGWETTTAVNAGFDIGLLDERIRFEVDAYKSQTTDQIFSRVIPPMSNGFTSTRATMGQVDNTGIEFTLNTVNIKTKDIVWSSMLNFYLNRNKLVDLYGDGKDDIGSSLFIGKSLGAIYGYKLEGIVQEGDAAYISANNALPGDPKFANIDGSADGKITADDRTILGYGKENFRMNMGQTISYKNWELYALFSGIFSGNDYGMSKNVEAYNMTAAGLVKDKVSWWTAENKSNVYPRPNFNRSGDFSPMMAYGFVRLQDLNLSYSFRQQALKDIGIQNLRVYASAKNLFTITNWIGGDPEALQKLGTGFGTGFSPLQRSFLFGINLSF
jgi:TonB-linked SusC/RagA family outer membrane protein